MAGLRLSCADFTFPLLPHDHALRLIAMMGFDAVDIGVFSERSHLQPEHIATNPAAHGVALKQKAADHGLAIADVFVQLGDAPSAHAVSEPDAATRRADRDRFRQCVEFAHASGVKHMTGLPGVVTTEGLGTAIEETNWRMTAAAEAKLSYAIEPHVGSNCPTVDATKAFLQAVPGLTLTLDYGHFVYQGHDPAAPDELIPYASHAHVRGGAPGRLQASVAKNVIDFRPLVRSGATRYVAVEYVWVDWEGCNEVDNVSETILMRQHLQSLAKSAKKAAVYA